MMVESSIRQLVQDDLIVARATPPGPGAIAIVRIDGKGAAELIGGLFHPRGSTHPVNAPRRAILGRWINPRGGQNGAVIDEGLTTFFKGPQSYTGNDLAELSCHGSAAVIRRLIDAATGLGARPAEPGEFTRRAFLNGRIDLTQAEAIADLVAAETSAAARSAQAQLAGGLSRRINELREGLIEMTAEIEAHIDFPDEGIEEEDQARLNQAFDAVADGVDRLIGSRRRGRLLREGVRVALVGPPNVGKSSLLNALARTDRAIVTPHPGTTRDTVECTIDLGGIAVTLVDTAGLRASDEPIERIGIERARRAIEEADAIVEVRDATRRIPSLTGEASARGARLIAENKIDLVRGVRPPDGVPSTPVPVIEVSALTGEGIEKFEAVLEKILVGEESGPESMVLHDAIAVSRRHARLLERARDGMAQARTAWDQDLGNELVTIDLRQALAALDEILGLAPNEAILDRIFERFCLGK